MAAFTFSKFFKNFFLILLWICTTLAASLICFYGMSFITSIVFLATIAFLINFAVEGEVYRQTIIEGFKRLQARYTKHEMVRNFLLELLKNDKGATFWYELYQNTLIKRLKEESEGHLSDEEIGHIDHLEEAALYCIVNPSSTYKQYEAEAYRLKEEPIPKKAFDELTTLIKKHEDERKKLLADINGTIWKTRLTLFLSFCAGFVMALVGVLSLQAATNAFGFLSFLTLPYILAISAVAAIGFTLMYYGAVAKFIQNSSWSKLKEAWHWFCHGNEDDWAIKIDPKKKDNWVKWQKFCAWCKFILGRIFIVVVILAFVIFSNVITAACWRGASEEGLSKFAGDNTAIYISSYLLVGLMFLPIMLYGLSTTLVTLEKWFGFKKKEKQNSSEEKLEQKDHQTDQKNTPTETKETQENPGWVVNKPEQSASENAPANNPEQQEGQGKNDPGWTWINPFRIIDYILTSSIQFILFWGHMFAAGLMADNWGPIPAIVCIILGGLGDGISDGGFMPKKPGKTAKGKDEEGHSHTSWLLMVMSFPINLVIFVFRALAAVWDFVLVGLVNLCRCRCTWSWGAFCNAWSESWNKMQPFMAFRCDEPIEKHEEIEQTKLQAIRRDGYAAASSSEANDDDKETTSLLSGNNDHISTTGDQNGYPTTVDFNAGAGAGASSNSSTASLTSVAVP
ncbi:MAG: hypothetical protein M1561_01450 [Gammaproteobacteria bacterium]|nr:hypothetical protein [Gammaproteobacteria bacterium]